ncbi:MAG: DNA-directed RNA polymerase subunit L [Candidatus Aenigmarchaeota archaeon]|nr:DNA-directed RNA polymerase subunit L [Candidatus Aenigmarchaeota archaeon]
MMELKTIKRDTNFLEIELKGESIGFVNLIKEELWEDENVDEAACVKEHPYMAEPKLYIRMKGKNTPEAAIERAIKRIQVKVKELKGEFERALKS